MWGLGFKGKYEKWSYKVQYMSFQFDEEPIGLDGVTRTDNDFDDTALVNTIELIWSW